MQLVSRTTRRATRRFLTTVSAAVRSVVAPATLVEQTEAPTVVEDPAGLYEADEMPPVVEIEAAAKEYSRAADQARRADRGKRAARKVLDKVPSGVYGMHRIFRTPSSRLTPDLAAITATYKRLGLGPVPMKACAPSLKVELVEVVPAAVDTAPAVLVAA